MTDNFDQVNRILGYELGGNLDHPNGHVFSAQHGESGQVVAIKILARHQSPIRPRKLGRDARKYRYLVSTANFVPLLDSGTTAAGNSYIATPIFASGSLDDVISRGPIPWGDAVQIVAKATRTIAVAHDQGIAFTTLRPSSILLAAPGSPIVSMYGMARTRLDDGSTYFSAPEVRQQNVETIFAPSADVYSLTLILACLLLGRKPSQAEPAASWLDTLAEQIPKGLHETICQGIDPSQSVRLGDASRLSRALVMAAENSSLPLQDAAPLRGNFDQPTVKEPETDFYQESASNQNSGHNKTSEHLIVASSITSNGTGLTLEELNDTDSGSQKTNQIEQIELGLAARQNTNDAVLESVEAEPTKIETPQPATSSAVAGTNFFGELPKMVENHVTFGDAPTSSAVYTSTPAVAPVTPLHQHNIQSFQPGVAGQIRHGLNETQDRFAELAERLHDSWQEKKKGYITFAGALTFLTIFIAAIIIQNPANSETVNDSVAAPETSLPQNESQPQTGVQNFPQLDRDVDQAAGSEFDFTEQLPAGPTIELRIGENGESGTTFANQPNVTFVDGFNTQTSLDKLLGPTNTTVPRSTSKTLTKTEPPKLSTTQRPNIATTRPTPSSKQTTLTTRRPATTERATTAQTQAPPQTTAAAPTTAAPAPPEEIGEPRLNRLTVATTYATRADVAASFTQCVNISYVLEGPGKRQTAKSNRCNNEWRFVLTSLKPASDYTLTLSYGIDGQPTQRVQRNFNTGP